MWKSKYYLAIAIATVLSVTVLADGIGLKNSVTPQYVMISGLSPPLDAVVSNVDDKQGIAYEIQNILISDKDILISLDSLKPDKEMKFYYNVLKPTNLAVIQNQNFDRVLPVLTY